MCVVTEKLNIWFEYNGSLHAKFNTHNLKCKINDKIKKIEICKNKQEKLVRLWSNRGLYSRPEIFEEGLYKVKEMIEYLIKANNSYGQCIDIVITFNKNNYHIDIFKEKFKDDIVEEC